MLLCNANFSKKIINNEKGCSGLLDKLPLNYLLDSEAHKAVKTKLDLTHSAAKMTLKMSLLVISVSCHPEIQFRKDTKKEMYFDGAKTKH